MSEVAIASLLGSASAPSSRSLYWVTSARSCQTPSALWLWVCMAEVQAEDWEDYINRFSTLFWCLYHHEDLSGNQRKINETYKIYNLIDHLPDTFR